MRSFKDGEWRSETVVRAEPHRTSKFSRYRKRSQGTPKWQFAGLHRRKSRTDQSCRSLTSARFVSQSDSTTVLYVH